MTFPVKAPNFQPMSWADRVKAWLHYRPSLEQEFLSANRDAIRRCVGHGESGLRMVVNIPADGLLRFLADGRYKNAYELPFVAGAERQPSTTRQQVDKLVHLVPPKDYYFGAIALGGTGIRFYGEYCLSLRPDSIDPQTGVFDRNSYDLIQPPFKGHPGLAALVNSLKGRWDTDVVDMLTLKVLPELRNTTRFVTLGTVSDCALHDEDYLEVHRRGTFQPSDVEEVRQAPEEQAVQSRILDNWAQGTAPTLAELVWLRRRARVERALRHARVKSRVVASSGRGSRWD